VKKSTQSLVACLFVAVIFAPLIVGMFGYKPKAIENRPLTEFPAMRDMFSDPKFLDRAKEALTDHLSLRAEVVTAGAWLDMALFKLSYNPIVKVGNRIGCSRRRKFMMDAKIPSRQRWTGLNS